MILACLPSQDSHFVHHSSTCSQSDASSMKENKAPKKDDNAESLSTTIEILDSDEELEDAKPRAVSNDAIINRFKERFAIVVHELSAELKEKGNADSTVSSYMCMYNIPVFLLLSQTLPL
jgi:hypothetical protein